MDASSTVSSPQLSSRGGYPDTPKQDRGPPSDSYTMQTPPPPRGKSHSEAFPSLPQSILSFSKNLQLSLPFSFNGSTIMNRSVLAYQADRDPVRVVCPCS